MTPAVIIAIIAACASIMATILGAAWAMSGRLTRLETKVEALGKSVEGLTGLPQEVAVLKTRLDYHSDKHTPVMGVPAGVR